MVQDVTIAVDTVEVEVDLEIDLEREVILETEDTHQEDLTDPQEDPEPDLELDLELDPELDPEPDLDQDPTLLETNLDLVLHLKITMIRITTTIITIAHHLALAPQLVPVPVVQLVPALVAVPHPFLSHQKDQEIHHVIMMTVNHQDLQKKLIK
jgi:hypothetical protein